MLMLGQASTIFVTTPALEVVVVPWPSIGRGIFKRGFELLTPASGQLLAFYVSDISRLRFAYPCSPDNPLQLYA